MELGAFRDARVILHWNGGDLCEARIRRLQPAAGPGALLPNKRSRRCSRMHLREPVVWVGVSTGQHFRLLFQWVVILGTMLSRERFLFQLREDILEEIVIDALCSARRLPRRPASARRLLRVYALIILTPQRRCLGAARIHAVL